ncbi:MAG: hypothetical protein JST16_08220 [Bdellovibrionales bacterium]|nr:hypothetical protein [Bdellovibrionales bacterium]
MKTKIFSILSTFGLAATAHAHLDLGTYQGKDNFGLECRIAIKEINFEYNYHHPLNERVSVMVGINNYVLQHLPQIDTLKNTVTPEEGMLTGVAGTSTSSQAVRLKVSHTPGKAGPVEFTVVNQDDDYPTNSLTTVCSDLHKVN